MCERLLMRALQWYSLPLVHHMREKLKIILTASVPAVFLIFTGCASSAHSPAEKYVLIAASTKVQYWQTAFAGLQKAGGEMSVKTALDGPDGHDAQAEQAALRRAVAGKPSGILISVADADLLTPDINAAIGQGIPVITIDSDAPDSQRLLFIGTNNYNAGMMGGKLAVKLLNGKGNVVFFQLPNQPNQASRLAGYKAAFEASPQIKVTQVIDLKDEPDRSSWAFDTTKKMLDSKEKVDAFVCLESRACGGVADAVSRASLAGKVAVIGMDTDTETLDWLGKGVISATIAQKPFTMGYYGAKLVDDLFHHPPTPLAQNWAHSQNAPLPSFVDTGSFIVDKTNLASFQQQSKAPGQ